MYKAASYLKMAVLSLYLNRLRSLLSILGIVFGVMAVIGIISVGEGTKREALRQIEQLGLQNVYIRSIEMTEAKRQTASTQYNFGLTKVDLRLLEKGCATLDKLTALKEVHVSIVGTQKELSPQIVAVTDTYFDILGLKIASGRLLTTRDQSQEKNVCLLGAEIARDLGKHGRVGETLQIEDQQYKIVGILTNSKISAESSKVISVRNYNKMVFLPLNITRWLPQQDLAESLGGDHLTEIIVRIKQPVYVLAAALQIQKIMEKIHPSVHNYQVVTPLELLNQTKKTKQLFSLFLLTIAAISLLVGGIGIMNIMLATVMERRVEIGTRRAVGAKRMHILIQFLTESCILTILGGFIGVLFGVGLVVLLSLVFPWQTFVTMKAIILPLGISSLVGILSGVYPAYTAAHADPIQALRS